jgi:hypothetical protein
MLAERMVEVTTYRVTAKRWARGWELDVPADSFNVEITPAVGDGLDAAAQVAREATRAASESAAGSGV